MKELRGRTAVVTGAGSGIGRALSIRFAAAGMNVVLADIDQAALGDASEEIRGIGADAKAVRTDVRDPADLDALAADAAGTFGPVHILCNNAGVIGGGMIKDLEIEDWSWTLSVNLYGLIYGLRAFLPGMIAHGEPGHVVNTASIFGLSSGPTVGPYAASKYAVVAISETLHHEMKATRAPIGVSVVCPGLVATPIIATDIRRRGDTSGTDLHGALADRLARIGIPPAVVADDVLDGIAEGRFWIVPHPELLREIRARMNSIVNGDDPPEIASAVWSSQRR